MVQSAYNAYQGGYISGAEYAAYASKTLGIGISDPSAKSSSSSSSSQTSSSSTTSSSKSNTSSTASNTKSSSSSSSSTNVIVPATSNVSKNTNQINDNSLAKLSNSQSSTFYVIGGDGVVSAIDQSQPLYAIGGDGKTTPLDQSQPISVMTGEGIITYPNGSNIGSIGGKGNEGIPANSSTQLVTAEQMRAFGWSISSDELAKLNDILRYYGITSQASIILFLATCAHESGFGSNSLEMLNRDGTTTGKYKSTERGAGYIQITWRDTHLKFLQSINDSFTGIDTATHISQKYAWEAAAWFWSSTSAKSTSAGSLNDYAARYGDSIGVYLITQCFVNGWPTGLGQSDAVKIRDGTVNWNISNGRLYIDGKTISEVPKGWSTPTTGRLDTYNSAVNAFK